MVSLVVLNVLETIHCNENELFDNEILFIFKFLILFLLIYLFLVALGLHCCTWALSSCVKQGLLFVAVHGLLIAVASLVAEHGL